MHMSKLLATAIGIFISLSIVPSGAGAHSEHQHDHETFAAGEPGDRSKPVRTVEVTMLDTDNGKMVFVPDMVTVRPGEQIRFQIYNKGRTAHEFMLDSAQHNARHKLAMQKNPEMQHDDPNGKTLDPDQSAEILWRFSKPGTFEFACLIPGHYEAGMHGSIAVK
jgi:uncharacterized cupredoxin-like copper-binding protein